MSELILASTSKYRAALLRRWQLNFTARDPELDEAPYKSRGLSPHDLVITLSEAKAQKIAELNPSAVVIGSDQVLCLGNEIFGKAGSPERALAQLLRLRGQTQRLITGLCVIHQGRAYHHLDQTEITLRDFSQPEAEAVLARDQSWDCAGSLKIEGAGTWLIDSVQTSDPSAIEGLPLIALGKILRDDLGLGPALFGG